MADANSPVYDPAKLAVDMFTLAWCRVAGVQQIAVIQADNHRTMMATLNASDARLFAADLIKMADQLDPPKKEWHVFQQDDPPKDVAADLLARIKRDYKRTAPAKKKTRKARRK